MRFTCIKHEQVCNYCQSILNPGDEAVVIRIKHRNGVVLPVFFHTDQCFERWNKETFVNRLLSWRLGATLPGERKKKAGRPRKYRKGEIARKHLALLRYHKKKGHDDKVRELQDELKKYELNER